MPTLEGFSSYASDLCEKNYNNQFTSIFDLSLKLGKEMKCGLPPTGSTRKVNLQELSDEELPNSETGANYNICLLYTSPSPRDQRGSRMPSSA